MSAQWGWLELHDEYDNPIQVNGAILGAMKEIEDGTWLYLAGPPIFVKETVRRIREIAAWPETLAMLAHLNRDDIIRREVPPPAS